MKRVVDARLRDRMEGLEGGENGGEDVGGREG